MPNTNKPVIISLDYTEERDEALRNRQMPTSIEDVDQQLAQGIPLSTLAGRMIAAQAAGFTPPDFMPPPKDIHNLGARTWTRNTRVWPNKTRLPNGEEVQVLIGRDDDDSYVQTLDPKAQDEVVLRCQAVIWRDAWPKLTKKIWTLQHVAGTDAALQEIARLQTALKKLQKEVKAQDKPPAA